MNDLGIPVLHYILIRSGMVDLGTQEKLVQGERSRCSEYINEDMLLARCKVQGRHRKGRTIVELLKA